MGRPNSLQLRALICQRAVPLSALQPALQPALSKTASAMQSSLATQPVLFN